MLRSRAISGVISAGGHLRSLSAAAKDSSGGGFAPKSAAGLSAAVLQVPSAPVGPGASKGGEYKNPEYFCYNTNSYFEAEVEMKKHRLPQPSAVKK